MFASPTSALRTLVRGALVATLLTTFGCEEEGPGKLFDEEGVWELTSFTLSGAGVTDVSRNRAGTFFLKFDTKNRVVQTAMCANREAATPDNSECEGFTDSQWHCQCFAYGFEEDQMAWQEFDAGTEPPKVKVGQTESDPPPSDGAETDEGSGSESGGGESSGGGEAGGGDEPPAGGPVHQFTVAEFATIGSTYDFTPLPAGLFGSDGIGSKFVFQKKANSKFDPVLEGDERPTCQPCI